MSRRVFLHIVGRRKDWYKTVWKIFRLYQSNLIYAFILLLGTYSTDTLAEVLKVTASFQLVS